MEQTETEPSTEETTVSEVFVKQDGKGFHESASRTETGSGDRNRTLSQWFVVVCSCFLCACIVRSLLALAFSCFLQHAGVATSLLHGEALRYGIIVALLL